MSVGRRQLLEEGIDQACLASLCMGPLTGCLADSGCMKALLGVQVCREDPLLTKLKSMCNPFPVSPLLPVVDACVNLAIYLFKDNPMLVNLTRCAQQNNCLTGLADISTCASVPVESNWNTNAFTPPDLWEARFEVGLARPGTRYTVVSGMNHGWDCMKEQHFQFSSSAMQGTLRARHILNLTANIGALRFPYLATLGGAPTALWDIVYNTCPVPGIGEQPACSQPGVWSEELTTAGIHESDPWLVLDVDPPLKSAKDGYARTGADFALVIMANNVGPIPNIFIPDNKIPGKQYPGGIPGGYILARDGLNLPRPAMVSKIAALQRQWARKYGDLSFDSWCKLYL